MSSLKHYQRDRELPGALGDAQLRLPSDPELLSLVCIHLCGDYAPVPVQADLIFARWKPATSVLGCWSVSFDDGRQVPITYKRYAGPKAESVAGSMRVNEYMSKAAAPLLPYAYLQQDSALLMPFPVDRVLRGAARVRDLRRTGRALDEAGLWPGKVFRRRSSKLELLRYKPERRAVFALHAELKLREPDGEVRPAGSRRLAVRALEPDVARLVAERRGACPLSVLPTLLHTELETGLLFEEWIEGEPVASEDFSHAVASSVALSQLHGQAAQGAQRSRSREGALELLARQPQLAVRAQAIEAPAQLPTSCWVHGDFHPDQLMRGANDTLRLLDADALRPGCPEEDYASWIADHLEHDARATTSDALAPLLEGSQTQGGGLDRKRLNGLIAEELIARAAAGLRRLQVDAVARATRLIERAEQVCSESDPL